MLFVVGAFLGLLLDELCSVTTALLANAPLFCDHHCYLPQLSEVSEVRLLVLMHRNDWLLLVHLNGIGQADGILLILLWNVARFSQGLFLFYIRLFDFL